MSRPIPHAARALAFVAAYTIAQSAFAQIVSDSTFSGHTTPLGGNAVTIPAALGRQVSGKHGGTLFQSFSTFNVDPGQTVAFESPGGVQRVIARVTGGTESTIAGTLQVGADFYFINPAGIRIADGAIISV